jgi:hypothetical protein
MWKPPSLTTLWASMVFYRDNFTFFISRFGWSNGRTYTIPHRAIKWCLLFSMEHIQLVTLKILSATTAARNIRADLFKKLVVITTVSTLFLFGNIV